MSIYTLLCFALPFVGMAPKGQAGLHCGRYYLYVHRHAYFYFLNHSFLHYILLVFPLKQFTRTPILSTTLLSVDRD